jgi:hypothetical protein
MGLLRELIQSQKGFTLAGILIIVLIIFGTGLGSYCLFKSSKPTSQPQPTPSSRVSETADWRTYTNTKYNFKIDHPSGLTILESEWEGNFAVSFTTRGGNVKQEDYIDLTIARYNLAPSSNLVNWVKEFAVGYFPDGEKRSCLRSEITPYKIGSIEGVTFVAGPESEHKYVSLIKDKIVFKFEVSGGETGSTYKDTRGEKIFEEFLVSFKFIN